MNYDSIRDLPLLTADEEKTATREELILHNTRLVASRVSRFEGRGVDAEDLEQEGMVGLIKAAEKFDPSSGTRFSTLATMWIDGEMRRAVQKAQQVRLPIYIQNERADEAVKPSFREAGTSGEAGVLDPEDRNSPSPEEQLEVSRWREKVEARLPLLSKRELRVLTGVYGLDGSPPKTVTVLAKEHDVSRGMISKIVARAKDKLRG